MLDVKGLVPQAFRNVRRHPGEEFPLGELLDCFSEDIGFDLLRFPDDIDNVTQLLCPLAALSIRRNDVESHSFRREIPLRPAVQVLDVSVHGLHVRVGQDVFTYDVGVLCPPRLRQQGPEYLCL